MGKHARAPIGVLPPLDHYWERLAELFDGSLANWSWRSQLRRPVEREERVWAPSPAAWSWGSGPALEPVRFAGANRLCIDLGYHGSLRHVEPYSLRVTQDGNLLLYAIRRDGPPAALVPRRPDPVDRNNNRAIHARQPGGVSSHGSPRRATDPLTNPRVRAGRLSPGPVFAWNARCAAGRSPACVRVRGFNPHKDPGGFPCPGRVGYSV